MVLGLYHQVYVLWMLKSESCTVIVPICLHDSAMVQYLLYSEYHHAGLLTGIMGAWVGICQGDALLPDNAFSIGTVDGCIPYCTFLARHAAARMAKRGCARDKAEKVHR